MLQAILLVVLAIPSTSVLDPPKNRVPDRGEPRVDYVPDPSWLPRISDEASTYSPSGLAVPAAASLFQVGDYARFLQAGDEASVLAMVRAGTLFALEVPTRVQVVNRFLRPIQAPRSQVLEVKVLEGGRAGMVVFLLEEFVERLILRPLVADPSYRHKVGDTVSALYDDTPFAQSWGDLDAFEQLRQDGDRAGMEAMIRDGKVALMPRLSQARIVDIHAVESRPTHAPPKDATARLDEAASYTAKHPAGYAVELQAPGGATAFASRRNVGHTVHGKVATRLQPSILALDRVKKVARPKTSPDEQARRALERADLLERAGRPDEALDAYQAITKEYPGTPSAKQAADRFDAMTGKKTASRSKK